MNIQGLEIDQKILWDADLNDLDVYKHKTYIVSRALTRGSLADIRAILKFYTKEEFKEATTKSKTLNEQAMYFAAHYLNISFQDFACYKLKQSDRNFLPHYGS